MTHNPEKTSNVAKVQQKPQSGKDTMLVFFVLFLQPGISKSCVRGFCGCEGFYCVQCKSQKNFFYTLRAPSCYLPKILLRLLRLGFSSFFLINIQTQTIFALNPLTEKYSSLWFCGGTSFAIKPLNMNLIRGAMSRHCKIPPPGDKTQNIKSIKLETY